MFNHVATKQAEVINCTNTLVSIAVLSTPRLKLFGERDKAIRFLPVRVEQFFERLPPVIQLIIQLFRYLPTNFPIESHVNLHLGSSFIKAELGVYHIGGK